MPLPTLRAGATVTHPHFSFQNLAEQAVIIELHKKTGLAELDNGQALPADQLTLVESDERWVDVAGYEGKYQVSSLGKVVATSFNRQPGRVRLLKAQRPATYPLVELSNGPVQQPVGINRLVAQHFLAPPADPSHTHLLPKDGNHLNLAADNLYWAPVADTGAVVAKRAWAAGKAHPNGKLTPSQAQTIREQVAQGRTHQSLAEEFGTSRPTVSRLVKDLNRIED